MHVPLRLTTAQHNCPSDYGMMSSCSMILMNYKAQARHDHPLLSSAEWRSSRL